MCDQSLVVGSGRTLTCCNLDGVVKFQVELQYQIESVELTRERIALVGEVSPNYLVSFLDFDGNEVHRLPTTSYPWVIKFDNSGDRLAAGLEYGELLMFGQQEGSWRLMHQWDADQGSIYAIVWLSDIEICIGGHDGTVLIWDSTTGSVIHRLQEGSRILTALCLSFEDINVLFSGYFSGHVRKWSLIDDSFVEIKVHVRDTQVICINNNNSAFIAYSVDDSSVAAFDFASLEEKWRFDCSEQLISVVAINSEVVVGCRIGPVLVLDLATGELLRQLSIAPNGRAHLGAVAPSLCNVKFID